MLAVIRRCQGEPDIVLLAANIIVWVPVLRRMLVAVFSYSLVGRLHCGVVVSEVVPVGTSLVHDRRICWRTCSTLMTRTRLTSIDRAAGLQAVGMVRFLGQFYKTVELHSLASGWDEAAFS